MKQWKIDLAEKVVADWKSDRCMHFAQFGETDRVSHFQTVANENGYKHIKTQDVIDILHQVKKINPELNAIRLWDDEKPETSQSLFTTLCFTDLDFN